VSDPDLARFSALTFDCYGTLIDWESGILAAMLPLLERHEVPASPDEILRAYARAEGAAERGRFISYREVLRRTLVGMASDLGFAPRSDEVETLAESLADWDPFPDTVQSLRTLGEKFRLGVISNVDEDLFQATRERLGIDFEWVITAESVGAYKPAPVVFERALARIARPREELLHAAQSLYHDIAPARAMGVATVHVRRDSGRDGGAVPEAEVQADWVVPDLRGLVALFGLG
jgi:2-haloalkanoic acid dehalogenase type II